MSTQRFRLRYPASKFWLIFWLILFFPIGIVLLLTHLKIVSGHRTFQMEYDGTRFWLYFWAIFFVPIVIVLMLLNGTFVKKTRG